MDKKTKEEKALDLEIRIIELELEKSKDLHKSGFAILAYVLIFVFSSVKLIDVFKESISNLTQQIVSTLPIWIALILILLIIILIPLGFVKISNLLFNLYLDSKEKNYDDSIRKLKNIHRQLLLKK